MGGAWLRMDTRVDCTEYQKLDGEKGGWHHGLERISGQTAPAVLHQRTKRPCSALRHGPIAPQVHLRIVHGCQNHTMVLRPEGVLSRTTTFHSPGFFLQRNLRDSRSGFSITIENTTLSQSETLFSVSGLPDKIGDIEL